MAITTGTLPQTVSMTTQYFDGESYFTASGANTQTFGLMKHYRETFADSVSDAAVQFDVDRSHLKMLLMRADGALTVETNDGATPDDIFNLTATNAVYWFAGIGEGTTASMPISDNISALFVTNSSGTTRTLEILCLTDATL